MLRRVAISIALLVLGAHVALALTAEEQLLAGLKRVKKEGLEPARGVLGVIADLPDCSLSSEQIKNAVKAAGFPLDGVNAALFGSVSRVEKKGGKLSLLSPKDQSIPIKDGNKTVATIYLKKKSTLTIRRSGESVLLRDFDGIEGSNGTFTASVKEITASPNRDGGTHLATKLKWAFFTKTIEKDLPKPKPEPRAEVEPEGEPTAGITETLRRRVGD